MRFFKVCVLSFLLVAAFTGITQAQIGLFDASMDIDNGNLGAEGSAAFDETTAVYTINGSGDDIWNAQDAFHFLYEEVSGDFDLVADVTITGGNADQAWIKSVMMARQDLTPGSANVATRIRRDGQFSIQWRGVADDSGSGGSTPGDDRVYLGESDLNMEIWTLRFQRIGDVFYGSYLDADGVWQVVDEHELALADPIYVGFGVTAHDTGEIATGTFGNVSMIYAAPVGDPLFTNHTDIYDDYANLGLFGDATYDVDTATYQIKASGADVWGEADQFHYLYTSAHGDFTFQANGQFLRDEEYHNSSSEWVKMMLMARQDISYDAVNFATRIRDDGQFSWQYRAEAAGGSSSTDGANRVVLPDWAIEEGDWLMRLQRVGDTFYTHLYDPFDEAWVEIIDAQEIVMTDPILVGLAVTSHEAGSGCVGQFTDVVFEGQTAVMDWQLTE